MNRTLLVLLALVAFLNATGIVKDLLYGEWWSTYFGAAGLTICAVAYRFALRPKLRADHKARHDLQLANTAEHIAKLEKELGIGEQDPDFGDR